MADSASPPTKRAKTDAEPPVSDLSTKLQIKKLSDKARTPTRGSAFAAGYDLYAAAPAVLPAKGQGLVSTDIALAVPLGTCEPRPATTDTAHTYQTAVWLLDPV